MPWKTHILVVANVTADSEELLDALSSQASQSPTVFTLVLPPTHGGHRGRRAAHERLAHALAHARERGLEIDGLVGDPDPILAVTDTFDPRRYDQIVVSTLPAGASRWLQVALPHRIGRLTGAPVRHIVAEPHREVPVMQAPEPERRGVLAPLTPLTWGERRGSADRPRRTSSRVSS